VDFLWDDLNDPLGNTYHILSGHPEMQSTAFIEKAFSTPSGDEQPFTSKRGRKTYLVIEKTFRGKLYKFVFEKNGAEIKMKTAHRISKRGR
jgi:hypothetical protein